MVHLRTKADWQRVSPETDDIRPNPPLSRFVPTVVDSQLNDIQGVTLALADCRCLPRVTGVPADDPGQGIPLSRPAPPVFRCQYMRISVILSSAVSQNRAPRASTHSPVLRRRKVALNSVANQGPAAKLSPLNTWILDWW